MKIGIITDIHGNLEALQAVLEEFKWQRVDQIICLGDVVNPLPASKATVELLKSRNIPTLRGNHEDYIIQGFRDAKHAVNHAPHFQAVKVTKDSFDELAVNYLDSLPMTLEIPHRTAGTLLLCHASPNANNKGWIYGVEPELEEELKGTKASMIVCGHWHTVSETSSQGIKLVSAGSVGIPLSGRCEAEALIVEVVSGEWRTKHINVPYDVKKTVDDYLNSGWFHQGGAIAWHLLVEIATGQRTLSSFFGWLSGQSLRPETKTDWELHSETYLKETGHWKFIHNLL